MLPIRRTADRRRRRSGRVSADARPLLPVVVVDGSPPASSRTTRRLAARDRCTCRSTTTAAATSTARSPGVVTGLRRVRTAKAVIADDDVRYDPFALRRHRRAARRRRRRAAAERLRAAAVARAARHRPHADRARDRRRLAGHARACAWTSTPAPAATTATCCSRTSSWCARCAPSAGASASRTTCSSRGARRPRAHYFSQRVRQAYDEFARPGALGGRSSPSRRRSRSATAPLRRCGRCAAFALGAIALAELGRRRGGGAARVPAGRGAGARRSGCSNARDLVVRARAARRARRRALLARDACAWRRTRSARCANGTRA